jgi:hypothetical protein
MSTNELSFSLGDDGEGRFIPAPAPSAPPSGFAEVAPAPTPANGPAVVSGRILEEPILDELASAPGLAANVRYKRWSRKADKALRASSPPVNPDAPSRINPDSRAMLYVAVGLVFVLMGSSFAVSFSGIYDVSEFTGLPVWLQFMPALFIDAAILAYTISLFIFKARGESTWRTMAGLMGFALLSVLANIAHTLNFWDGDLADYRAWIGVAITASAPIAVLLASEEIARLAFIKHNPVGKK